MAVKTNCVVNGVPKYRIRKKVGKKLNPAGEWVDDIKNFYGKSKLDAEKQYFEYMEKGQPERGNVSKRYFGEVADFYLYNVFLIGDKYSNGSKRRYAQAYKKFIRSDALCGRALCELTSVDIQFLYNNSDASYASLRAAHNFMKGLFKYLEIEGFCKDLTPNLILPNRNKEVTLNEVVVWRDEEMKKIVSGAQEHRLRLLFLLAANTGLREGELLALEYADIKEGILYVNKQLVHHTEIEKEKTLTSFKIDTPKTKNSVRQIPLSASILKEIEYHKSWHQKEMLKNGYRTETMFTTNSGKFYDRSNLRTALIRHCKKCGVAYKEFHTFRRTFCTNLCKAGVPLQVAYKLMGHANINVTAQFYTSVDNSEKKNAIERLDAIVFSS